MVRNLYKNIAASLAIISAVIMGGFFEYMTETTQWKYPSFLGFGMGLLYYFAVCNEIAFFGSIILIATRLILACIEKRKQRSFDKHILFRIFRFLYMLFMLFNSYILISWILCIALKIPPFDNFKFRDWFSWEDNILYGMLPYIFLSAMLFMIIDMLVSCKKMLSKKYFQ